MPRRNSWHVGLAHHRGDARDPSVRARRGRGRGRAGGDGRVGVRSNSPAACQGAPRARTTRHSGPWPAPLSAGRRVARGAAAPAARGCPGRARRSRRPSCHGLLDDGTRGGDLEGACRARCAVSTGPGVRSHRAAWAPLSPATRRRHCCAPVGSSARGAPPVVRSRPRGVCSHRPTLVVVRVRFPGRLRLDRRTRRPAPQARGRPARHGVPSLRRLRRGRPRRRTVRTRRRRQQAGRAGRGLCHITRKAGPSHLGPHSVGPAQITRVYPEAGAGEGRHGARSARA